MSVNKWISDQSISLILKSVFCLISILLGCWVQTRRQCMYTCLSNLGNGQSMYVDTYVHTYKHTYIYTHTHSLNIRSLHLLFASVKWLMYFLVEVVNTIKSSLDPWFVHYFVLWSNHLELRENLVCGTTVILEHPPTTFIVCTVAVIRELTLLVCTADSMYQAT